MIVTAFVLHFYGFLTQNAIFPNVSAAFAADNSQDYSSNAVGLIPALSAIMVNA